MREEDRFVYYPMHKPEQIQPDCPVYVYGYGLAVQRSSGAAFVQVRLVNRSEEPVNSVFLRISGKTASGEVLYELGYVPLVHCRGGAHRDFGEEQVLFLPQGDVHSLDVRVEDVLFEDGMIWRRQSGHRLLSAEEAGWILCSCGMKNPGEAEYCAYCRRPISGGRQESGETPIDFFYPGVKTLTLPPEPPVDEEQEELPAETVDREEAASVILPQEELHIETADREATPVQELPDYSSMGEPESAAEPVTFEEPAAPQEEVPVPADLMEELEKLLFPFGGWTAGDKSPAEEAPAATVPEAVAEPEDEEAPVPETWEPELPMDMMQETGEILMELQRRLLARETGEITDPVVQEEQPPVPQEGQESKNSSGGIGFWVFMILLMVVLALAGFFGVLYFKGYFG